MYTSQGYMTHEDYQDYLESTDEDGDYGWTCECGVTADSVQPIAAAEIHVDIQCEKRN